MKKHNTKILKRNKPHNSTYTGQGEHKLRDYSKDRLDEKGMAAGRGYLGMDDLDVIRHEKLKKL